MDPNPLASSLPLDSYGTSYSIRDGSEVQKGALREWFRPAPFVEVFFAEVEVLYRMVSVHHSVEQSETIFKLISEGMS